MLSFFPRDVLDETLDLIESVSEGFPTYSSIKPSVLFSFLLSVPCLQQIVHSELILFKLQLAL